jgi:AcrR family transcriptional regulator
MPPSESAGWPHCLLTPAFPDPARFARISLACRPLPLYFESNKRLIQADVSVEPTRQKLLDTAGQLFAAKGFQATTVREVCQAADANIAAVHYHFGDKERLYIECVRLAHCQQDVTRFDWPDGMSPQHKLAAIVTHMLSLMLATDRPQWQVELMVRELARPTQACRVLVEEFISPMFSQLLAVVSEMFPANAPLLIRQQAAFSVVAQCLLYRYHRPIGQLLIGEQQFQQLLDAETVSQQVIAFSLAGIRQCALQCGAEHAAEVP